MNWYKVSSGEYPDEYVEIILGHEEKYTKEEFAAIVQEAKGKLPPPSSLTIPATDTQRILMEEYGFIVLPITAQYHMPRNTKE
jgi:hypothetical protein